MSLQISPFIITILFSVALGVPIAPLYQAPTLVQSSSLGLTQLQPVYGKQVVDIYSTNPQYSFAYKVEDGYTGDSKSQEESRNGDVVKGQYSLIDADGYRRIVDYSSDDINGFNAIVTRQPLVGKSIVEEPILKTVSQPILKTINIAQPLVKSAVPSLKNYYSTIAATPLISTQSLFKSAPTLLTSYAGPQSTIKTSPVSFVNSQPIINAVSY